MPFSNRMNGMKCEYKMCGGQRENCIGCAHWTSAARWLSRTLFRFHLFLQNGQLDNAFIYCIRLAPFFMRIDANGPRQLCYELCIISVLMGYSLMNAAPTVNERWQQTAKSKKRPLLLNKTKWHLANHTIPSRPHTRCWNLTTMKMNVKMKEVHSVFFFFITLYGRNMHKWDYGTTTHHITNSTQIFN